MKKIVFVLGLLVSLALTSEVNAEKNQEGTHNSNITNSIQLRVNYVYSMLFNGYPPSRLYHPDYPRYLNLARVAYVGGGQYIGYYN